MNRLNEEEQAAAAVVAQLSGKRNRIDSPDTAGGFKIARITDVLPEPVAAANPMPPIVAAPLPAPPPVAEESTEVLNPYPFFYYTDFSTVKDPDSLTPLTPPGRVPNFPAKMHAILSRPDLVDVICWMPHGRSWKILKPRDFEIRIIPTYFEHAKFSSFIRQANGWGFRRLTTGMDRNSYYHPLFLRAMPHLCKDMKRPGVAKKLAADPEHEPNLTRISEQHPVPENYEDDSVLLQCTLQGGPKARMPIYTGSLNTTTFASFMKNIPSSESNKAAAVAPLTSQLTPPDQEALSSFQAALGASVMNKSASAISVAAPTETLPMPISFPSLAATPSPMASFPMSSALSSGPNKVSTLAVANQMAFGNPQFAAAFQASSAASQFAAGFAAAAALSHAQFQSMLSNMQQQQHQETPSSKVPHNFSLP